MKRIHAHIYDIVLAALVNESRPPRYQLSAFITFRLRAWIIQFLRRQEEGGGGSVESPRWLKEQRVDT